MLGQIIIMSTSSYRVLVIIFKPFLLWETKIEDLSICKLFLIFSEASNLGFTAWHYGWIVWLPSLILLKTQNKITMFLSSCSLILFHLLLNKEMNKFRYRCQFLFIKLSTNTPIPSPFSFPSKWKSIKQQDSKKSMETHIMEVNPTDQNLFSNSKPNISAFDQTVPRFQTLFDFFSSKLFKKMHRGAALHTFYFIPTKESCQLKRVSLTMEGSSQNTPNKENNYSHKTIDLAQERRVWSIDSLQLYKSKTSVWEQPPSSLELI